MDGTMRAKPAILDRPSPKRRAEGRDEEFPFRPKTGGRLRRDAWQLFSLPLLLFIALPILAIFARLSPADFWAGLRQEETLKAIQLSLTTSLCTVALTLLFGTPVAYLLYRPRSILSRILDTLIDLPTVLPPAVAGVALLMAFGRGGLLGGFFSAFGLQIPFTTAAVILAQTFIAAPLYVKSAALGFAAVDCELKKAAALDGASRWQVFRYILLPLAWMPMFSGSILTWARALGEFGATILFAGNFPGRTQTMPLAIYIGFEIDFKVALTLSAVLICISFGVLALVKWILHERLAEPSREETD
jgi:molybdate transport system permease protein